MRFSMSVLTGQQAVAGTGQNAQRVTTGESSVGCFSVVGTGLYSAKLLCYAYDKLC